MYSNVQCFCTIQGFFGRSVTRKTKFKCKLKGECEMRTSYKSCSACRYKKCLTLGMSKQGQLLQSRL